MKRSEMLNKLKEVVYTSSYNDIILSDEETGHLLTLIEEAGMVPPPYIDMPNRYIRSTGEYGYECYEWEPETENNS